MKKLIIYGMGQIYLRFKEQLWNDNVIVAVTDSNIVECSSSGEVPVICPSQISSYQFDYVAICSKRWFNQIEELLIGEYGITEDKIISAQWLLEHKQLPEECAVQSIVDQNDIQTVLDFKISVMPAFFYQKGNFLPRVSIDGIGKELYPYYKNIYNNIYSDYNEVKEYDALLYYVSFADSCNLERELEQIEDILHKGKIHNVIIISNVVLESNIVEKMNKWGKVKNYKTWDSMICFISLKRKVINSPKAQIYVVSHKKYNLYSDETYVPLFVGKYKQETYLSELVNDNISDLNCKINECTGLYWIWKNSDAEIVGLVHYRRYFYNNNFECRGNRLNYDMVERYLKEFDIILPPIFFSRNKTIEEYIKDSVDLNAYGQSREIIRKYIKEKQSSYVEAFDFVMTGHLCYYYNMFVSRKKIFDEYCEWLFSFLIDAAREMYVECFDDYSKRIIGFWAERLPMVWFVKHNYRIKELPVFRPN